MAERDLLERAKREIRKRLEELYPLVEERDRRSASRRPGHGRRLSPGRSRSPL